MRLYELFEAVDSRLRDAGESHVTVKITKRFAKDFKNFRTIPTMVQEFERFLDTKVANINASFGKKDGQWMGGTVSKLNGWRHAHLFFGKAVIIYKAFGNTLILAAITDHLSIEGSGMRIRELGDYLDKIDFDPTISHAKMQDKSVTAQSVSPEELDTALDIDIHSKLQQSAADVKSVKLRTLQLFHQIAAEPADRPLLQDFVSGKSNELMIFLKFAEPPIADDALSAEQFKEIANQSLKDIPSHT